jgi:putative intracellular protease/amidase
MSKGNVLIAVSAADEMQIVGRVTKTGTYLNELVVPVMALIDAGYEVTLATPTGGKPVLDKDSLTADHFGKSEEAFKKATEFFETAPIMQNPKTLKAVLDGGLDKFSGIFVPGGQAPITDLAQDETLGKILTYFHENAKPTALLCHGPIALLSAMTEMKKFREALDTGDAAAAKAAASKGWPYAGYKMTIFSNAEEIIFEDNYLHGKMLWRAEDALKAAGGVYSSNTKVFDPYLALDRELITGQNPASDHVVASALIKALAAKTAAAA